MKKLAKLCCGWMIVMILHCLLSVNVLAAEMAMFPMEYMNISQGVNGTYSHQGRLAIDICGKDTGKDAFYAPFTGTVKRIYGSDNVVWLESNEPVQFADGTVDYMTIMCMHDEDISDLYVGKVINQGDWFLTEGMAGSADGNHIHLECGKGKFSGSGWYENSYGKWCINNGVNPWDALYLSNKTIIYNDYGYNWRKVDTTSAPTNATLSINKFSYSIGETVYFSCSSENATGYTIGIDKDGSRIFTSDINTTFEKSFNEAGNYSAYITAWNSIGSIDSNRVNFTVTDKLVPIDTVYYNGSVYALYEQSFTWTEAQSFCESASGHLVTIENSSEQNIIYNLVKKGNFNSYFIGYTDKDAEQLWKWVTNEKKAYENWNDGEPNDTGGNEDYAEIRKSDGLWNDITNTPTSSTGFILEIDTLNPAVTTSYGNNNIYYRFDISMTWTEAKAYCEMLGGHLLSISSSAENDRMTEFISDGAKNSYWLGYTDCNNEGNFSWINNETTNTYSNWDSSTSEPNNANGCEDYACIKKSGLWNDLKNSEIDNVGFICEFNNMIPKKTVVYGGHIYSIYEYSLSWEDARNLCREWGGYLATITSEKEDEVIMSLLDFAKAGDYFIGATDVDNEGVWKWISGEEWRYTKWHSSSNEPNGGKNENYLSIMSNKDWNDIANYYNTPSGFILEIVPNVYLEKIGTYNNSSYYMTYSVNNIPWTAAKEYGTSLGGHLATINSAEENEAVYNMLKNSNKSLDGVWIGGYSENGTNFKWANNEFFKYSNWSAGEPNNYANSERYAVLLKDNGKWNDLSNSECGKVGFIYELDSSKIKLYSQLIDEGDYYEVHTSTLNQSGEVTYISVVYNSDGEVFETQISDEIEEDTIVCTKIEKNENAAYIKIFAWDALDSMIPLAESEIIEL